MDTVAVCEMVQFPGPAVESKLAGLIQSTTHEWASFLCWVVSKHHIPPTSCAPPRGTECSAINVHLSIGHDFPNTLSADF